MGYQTVTAYCRCERPLWHTRRVLAAAAAASDARLPQRACGATCHNHARAMPRAPCRTLRMESLRSASSALPSVVTHSACGHGDAWVCDTCVSQGVAREWGLAAGRQVRARTELCMINSTTPPRV